MATNTSSVLRCALMGVIPHECLERGDGSPQLQEVQTCSGVASLANNGRCSVPIFWLSRSETVAKRRGCSVRGALRHSPDEGCLTLIRIRCGRRGDVAWASNQTLPCNSALSIGFERKNLCCPAQFSRCPPQTFESFYIPIDWVVWHIHSW